MISSDVGENYFVQKACWLPPSVIEFVEGLKERGIFGHTEPEVVRSLLERAIAELIKDDYVRKHLGTLAMLRPSQPPASSIYRRGSSAGFRNAICTVLHNSPNGLTPRQIAAAVLESGFEYKATTDINVRVNNDLHRMLGKKVSRLNGLYYLITQEWRNKPLEPEGVNAHKRGESA